ncbi:MAG: 2-methylaconitate cis-trans isomerase PrpF [Gemmatimonadetes bacterium]|nr:2-methylaconitate cis-trans isomerase PrpF [Gemmatimonadota bacterium]
MEVEILTQVRIPAVLMRGGTSKGVFFRGGVLPADPDLRDRVLLRIFGSPDPFRRQIDGVGGAASVTSKAAIVSPSVRPDSDVDYLFAQISIDRPLVDYSSSCGNLSSAVGSFAIEEGMVAAAGEQTTVRIWQVNTRKRILAHVATRDGLPLVDGDYEIDGVPSPGARITLEFLDPAASATGHLLPSGRAADRLDVPGVGEILVTLVDAGAPAVLVSAAEIGLRGTELAPEIDERPELLARLEAIRSHGAVAMGLASSPGEATLRRPATPKIAMLAPATPYVTSRGTTVEASRVDVVARVMSMGRLHQAYSLTGATATSVATLIPGTVANRAAGIAGGGERVVRLGHPSGIMEATAVVEMDGNEWAARKVMIGRTARRLMEGCVLIPGSVATAWSPEGTEKAARA